MEEMINIMMLYCNDSLEFFGNTHITNFVNDILKNGTEADMQLSIYNKHGFKKLKKYLMNSVEYNL